MGRRSRDIFLALLLLVPLVLAGCSSPPPGAETPPPSPSPVATSTETGEPRQHPAAMVLMPDGGSLTINHVQGLELAESTKRTLGIPLDEPVFVINGLLALNYMNDPPVHRYVPLVATLLDSGGSPLLRPRDDTEDERAGRVKVANNQGFVPFEGYAAKDDVLTLEVMVEGLTVEFSLMASEQPDQVTDVELPRPEPPVLPQTRDYATAVAGFTHLDGQITCAFFADPEEVVCSVPNNTWPDNAPRAAQCPKLGNHALRLTPDDGLATQKTCIPAGTPSFDEGAVGDVLTVNNMACELRANGVVCRTAANGPQGFFVSPENYET